MQFDFIKDLDEYFCEVYANYDSLCLLPGYVMPKMQGAEKDEFGDYVAYTLPANTMRLALQGNKEQILQAFKERLVDKEFSFAFSPASVPTRIKNLFSKKAVHKKLKRIFKSLGVTVDEGKKGLTVSPKIWKKILRGRYLPTKNMIFSLALLHNMDYADVKELLSSIGLAFDYEKARDTVIVYLLLKKITVPEMKKAAIEEYRIDNLFIDWKEEA